MLSSIACIMYGEEEIYVITSQESAPRIESDASDSPIFKHLLYSLRQLDALKRICEQSQIHTRWRVRSKLLSRDIHEKFYSKHPARRKLLDENTTKPPLTSPRLLTRTL